MNTYWNADVYQRIGTPMQRWAQAVIDDLHLEGGETVLDAGCGPGAVTLDLARRLPRGRVIAVDISREMVEALARRVAEEGVENVEPLVGDLMDLRLDRQVDAVFSNAVFHWVPDHHALYRSLFRSTRRGGRLRAQCGGGDIFRRLWGVAREVRQWPEFRQAFDGFREAHHFRSVEETAAALESAGWRDVHVDTWEAPVAFDRREDAREYLRTIILRADVAALRPGDPQPYLQAVVDEFIRRYGEPFTPDYVRMDIRARRPDGGEAADG